MSLISSKQFLFAVITIIAYGLLLPFTGFYWDDLPFAWIAKFLGPAEFVPAFLPFRPFLGPIFYFTTSLIPPVPLYWQIFALVIRFLLGISAWWMFTQIFPTKKNIAYIASLLILIFPGYSQHWVALTHINQELIPFIFYLLSFGYTFKALRTQKVTDTIIALLLQICGIFPTEYFFGIEGLRFLFLLSFFQESFFERVKKSLKIFLPYLLIWILNAAWLFYYYRFGPYNSYEVAATQSPNLIFFLTQALDAIWKTGFYIWIQSLVLTFSSIPAPASLLTLGLVAVSFAFLYRIVFRSAQDESSEKSFSISLIVIGLIGILLGRLPSLAANLPLTLQSSYDRFMISMMIGGTLFVIGFIELIFKNQKTKIIIFSGLIALGVGQQFFNANIFRRDWQKQGEIYWQMAWRMPALQPNTVLLTHEMPIDYETDLAFTAPINWMYAPDYQRGNLPYIFLYTEKRIGGPTLPALEKDIPIFYPYRTVDFRSSTSNAVVIYMPRNGCLRVLDPKRGDEEIYARQPKVLTDAIHLSDLSRIIPNPEQPAIPPFFAELEHGWCYYFAKAELAQQQSDYQRVVSLGDEATRLGFTPEDLTEWLVFIEGYALTDNLEIAKYLSEEMLQADSRLRRGVCTVWEQIQATSQERSGQEIEVIMLSLGCNP
ncbi:MAG: DUF751 domain-containing protein [Anaerolineales bacterium]|nr:DUF751 domain-containing protein [Anaerolineales bacterium]